MAAGPDTRIEMVRHYLALRWPVEDIARKLGVSMSTVKRDRERINTGPDPVLPGGMNTGPVPPAKYDRHRAGAIAVLAVALAVLAAVLANIIWIRFLRTPLVPYVTICVQYVNGNVAGITGGNCLPGWNSVTIIPGR